MCRSSLALQWLGFSLIPTPRSRQKEKRSKSLFSFLSPFLFSSPPFVSMSDKKELEQFSCANERTNEPRLSGQPARSSVGVLPFFYQCMCTYVLETEKKRTGERDLGKYVCTFTSFQSAHK